VAVIVSSGILSDRPVYIGIKAFVIRNYLFTESN